MKKIIPIIIALIIIPLIYFPLFSGENTHPNFHYIGSFKSAKISYGRIYQLPSPDSLRTGGITYMGGIYFWAGAKVYGNRPQVVAGDGNRPDGKAGVETPSLEQGGGARDGNRRNRGRYPFRI